MSVAHEWLAIYKFTESCTPKELAILGKLFATFTRNVHSSNGILYVTNSHKQYNRNELQDQQIPPWWYSLITLEWL